MKDLFYGWSWADLARAYAFWRGLRDYILERDNPFTDDAMQRAWDAGWLLFGDEE